MSLLGPDGPPLEDDLTPDEAGALAGMRGWVRHDGGAACWSCGRPSRWALSDLGGIVHAWACDRHGPQR